MKLVINNWNELLNIQNTPEMYESAFLRIYIEYESFIYETFCIFALGKSYGTYLPKRKLDFTSDLQFREVIRGESTYLDCSKAIDRCSKHIFEKDPFSTLFSSTNYNDDLRKMKSIRNYLAHRSIEAKDKYFRSVLLTYDIKEFIEPGIFFQKQVKNSGETHYSKYCKIFKEINDFFHNDEILTNL